MECKPQGGSSLNMMARSDTQEIGTNFPEIIESKKHSKTKQKISSADDFSEKIRQVLRAVQRKRINLESDIKLNYRAQRTAELYELLDAVGKDEDTIELASVKQKVRESIENVQAEIQEYVAQQLLLERTAKDEQQKQKTSKTLPQKQKKIVPQLPKREDTRQLKSPRMLNTQMPKSSSTAPKRQVDKKLFNKPDITLAEALHRDEAYLHHIYGKPVYTGTRFTQKNPYLRLRSSPGSKNLGVRPTQVKKPHTSSSESKDVGFELGTRGLLDEKKNPAMITGQVKSAIPLSSPKRTRDSNSYQKNVDTVSMPAQHPITSMSSQSNVAVISIRAEDQKDLKQLTYQKLPSVDIECRRLSSVPKQNTKLVTFKEIQDENSLFGEKTKFSNPVLPTDVPQNELNPRPSNFSSQYESQSSSRHPLPSQSQIASNPVTLSQELATDRLSNLLHEMHIPSQRTEQELIANILTEVHSNKPQTSSSESMALSYENSLDRELVKRLVIEAIKENLQHLWSENGNQVVNEQIEIQGSAETSQSSESKLKTNNEGSYKSDREVSEKNYSSFSSTSDKSDDKQSDKSDKDENSSHQDHLEQFEEKEIKQNVVVKYQTPEISPTRSLERPATPSRTPSPVQQLVKLPDSPVLSDSEENFQGAEKGSAAIVSTPERTPPETPLPVLRIVPTPAPSPPIPSPEPKDVECVQNDETSYKASVKDAEVQMTPPEPFTESTLSSSVTTSEGVDPLLSDGELPYRSVGQMPLSGIPGFNIGASKITDLHWQKIGRMNGSNIDKNNTLSEGEIPVQYLQGLSILPKTYFDNSLQGGSSDKHVERCPSATDHSRSLCTSQELSLHDLSEGQVLEPFLQTLSNIPQLSDLATTSQEISNPPSVRSESATSLTGMEQPVSEGEIFHDNDAEPHLDFCSKPCMTDITTGQIVQVRSHNTILHSGKIASRQRLMDQAAPSCSFMRKAPITEVKDPYAFEQHTPWKCGNFPTVSGPYPLLDEEPVRDISSSLSEGQVEESG